MDKERYYTPTIEEFHVGFEFEVDYGSKWVKEAIYTAPEVVTLPYMKLENIRVKYLDKKDIESLGFVETSNNWFTIDAPGKLGYWTQVVIDFRWMYGTKPYKDISISGKRWKENDVIFRGIIKNKSELKVLLKQLNIK